MNGSSRCAAVTSRFVILVITQFADHVKIKFTSQLIKGMVRALQKFLKYFNETAISTYFVPILFACIIIRSSVTISIPFINIISTSFNACLAFKEF